MAIHTPDEQLYVTARTQFAYFDPSAKRPAFMENAGGSQCPNAVIDAIADYMRTSYAQLGAGYGVSNAATATVARAHSETKTFMNAHGVGEVVLGPSTSQLLENLGRCYSSVLGPGDEIIVQEACHEANGGPWYKAAERCGAKIRVWRVDPDSCETRLEDLRELVGPATKLVALVHISNILGEVLDLASVVTIVKDAAPEARVVADGVAFAPHLPVDVAAWGVDWYSFSSYKCWGPHAAALYGSHAAFEALGERGKGPNHFWIPAQEHVYKMELGGPSHEACAGIVALTDYLRKLADLAPTEDKVDEDKEVDPALEPAASGSVVSGAYTGVGAWTGEGADGNMALRLAPLTRQEVTAAYAVMQAMEQPVMEALVNFLASRSDVTVYGPRVAEPGRRVPVVSFRAAGMPSAEISARLQKEGFALRHGHMYAYRLLKALRVPDLDDGVVRISLLHYNTPAEVEGLIRALKTVLPAQDK